MDSVFVSYAFNSTGRRLAEFVKGVARTYSLRPVDGEALGGGPLNREIREHIEKADALVAVLTPKRPEAGNGEAADKSPSAYVRDELNHANSLGKPTIAVVSEGTVLAPGLWDEFERVELSADRPLDGFLKLGRTLSLWRSRGGRLLQVLLAPPDLAERVGQSNGDCRCLFRLTKKGQVLRDWSEAPALPEIGGVCAYLPGVTEDASVQLKVELKGETWLSRVLPQWVHVELQKRNT